MVEAGRRAVVHSSAAARAVRRPAGLRAPAQSGCSTACDRRPTRPTSRTRCSPMRGSSTASRRCRRSSPGSRSRAPGSHMTGAAERSGACPRGGGEQDLAERNRLAGLESEVETATRQLDEARQAAMREAAAAAALEESREGVEARGRDARRATQEAEEEARRFAWLADQRREHGDGPEAARRAQLEAEIAAERHVADRLAAERARHGARVAALEDSLKRDRSAAPSGRADPGSDAGRPCRIERMAHPPRAAAERRRGPGRECGRGVARAGAARVRASGRSCAW